MARRAHALVITAAALCGCGALSPNDSTLVAPASPTGTVVGQLLTIEQAPIAGATVTLSMSGMGDTTVTSDANGYWFVSHVPALATAFAKIHADGFADAYAVTQVPGIAGTVPMSNATALVGPVVMLRRSATVKFLVVSPSGAPAPNATVQLVVNGTAGDVGAARSSLSYPHGIPFGQMILSARSDATGLVTFTQVPDPTEREVLEADSWSYVATLFPRDANGDGVFDTQWNYFVGGGVAGSNPLANTTTPIPFREISAASSSSLDLAATNVNSLRNTSFAFGGDPTLTNPFVNTVASTQPLVLFFTRPIQPNLSVTIVDEFAKIALPPSTITYSADRMQATVTPSVPWTPGRELNLRIHATPADYNTSLQTLDRTGYFFVAPTSTAPGDPAITSITWKDTNADTFLSNGDLITVTFNQPLGFNSFWFGPFGFYAAGPPIAYVNRDLNGSTIIGDSPGELGYNGDTFGGGFEILENEPLADPTSLLAIVPSNYTTRWTLLYTGPSIAAPSAVAPVPVSIQFHRFDPQYGSIQTASGVPLLTDLSAPMVPAP